MEQPSTQSALVMNHGNSSHKNKSQYDCSHCGRHGHTSERCFHNPYSQSYRNSFMKNGGKNSHRRPHNAGHKNGNGKAPPAHTAMLTVSSALIVCPKVECSSKWIIDSACTAHMTNDQSNFTAFVSQDCSVQVGNKQFLDTKGVGTVVAMAIVKKKKQAITFSDVLYVPNILYNLLSVSCTRQKGFRSVFDKESSSHGLCYIEDPKTIPRSFWATKIQLVYTKLSFIFKKDARATALIMETTGDPFLWHRRLGQVSATTLSNSSKIVKGIPTMRWKEASKTCKNCKLGKSCPHSRMKRPGDHALKTLDRIYSDVVGPVRMRSFSNSQYFVTATDEYSGLSMVRFLRRKNQAADALQEMILEFQSWFNSTVSRLSVLNRRKVKWLRSDGGGEYVCSRLPFWFRDRGIIHEITAPYSPESNGRAEWLNRTLLDMARTMMVNISAYQRDRYWAEAVNCANTLRNRLYPDSCAEDVTPSEVIHEKPPNLSNARVYGYAAFCHVPTQKRDGKFSPRSVEGIVVRYYRGNSYRVLHPNSGKITTSQDDEFIESVPVFQSPPNGDYMIQMYMPGIYSSSQPVSPPVVGDALVPPEVHDDNNNVVMASEPDNLDLITYYPGQR